MSRIIAVCNAKGGVGKTTTSVNLSAYLAHYGRRTLLIDFDPQANASSALGSNPADVEKSIYHGIYDVFPAAALVRETGVQNFQFIPAAAHLAGLLVELVEQPDREKILRKFVNKISHLYDYIFIDLPPSLSLLTVNGLMAAHEILIPVQAEYYSLEGIGQLLETIELIKTNLRHDLKITGALLTMYDRFERHNREIGRNVRSNFPYKVFETEIPRHVALAEAPSFSKPIALYDPESPGAAAYRRLALEIINQEPKLLSAAHSRVINFATENFGNFNVSL